MRKILIIASGVYLFLLSLLFLTVAVVNFFNPQETVNSNLRFVIALIYVPIGIGLTATSVGLFLKKNWARLALVIMSAFAVVIGLMGTFGIVSLPAQVLEKAAQSELSSDTIKKVVIIFYLIFLISIPLFFIIFFNLKSIRDMFTFSSKESS